MQSTTRWTEWRSECCTKLSGSGSMSGCLDRWVSPPPPVYFLWFVCMLGILKCLAVTMKENVTNKWSDSLICCPGGKVQLHPAHHLHRINAVILRSSKRPPCFLAAVTQVSIHAFVLWTLNTDHHCVQSGCIWMNWITIKGWLSWICEMKATGGKFGVKIQIKKNFGCSRKEVRCLKNPIPLWTMEQMVSSGGM